MAFHVFLREKVDATILEVGIGGTYDSTNIVPKPRVAGVTTLGIDHVFVLGKTIEEIAQQKGGIYKKDTPALSVANQPKPGLEVLERRARELQASSFSTVENRKQLENVKLGKCILFTMLNKSSLTPNTRLQVLRASTKSSTPLSH
jgi:folylpolyglutamate synthase